MRLTQWLLKDKAKILENTFALTLLSATQVAFASTLGGLSKAQMAATDIKNGFFILVGIIVAIWLLYIFVLALSEKKSWADFGWGVVYTSFGGGAIALATWAWSIFQ